MSWKESARSERPCECGENTVITVYEGDDWNRQRRSQIINCPECAEKARMEAAEHERQQMELKKRLKELATDVETYFSARYLEDWQTYFAGAKGKKGVWEAARAAGVELGSLSTFYTYTKYTSMDEYIKAKVCLHYIPRIMELLNIDDDYLSEKVAEAEALRR